MISNICNVSVNDNMRYITIFLLFVLVNCYLVRGRVLSSHQLAVGEWNVTLRGGLLFDPHQIFPVQTRFPEQQPTVKQLNIKRRPWGSSIDCTCSLCDDGTFCLTPLSDDNSSHLPLRGEWEILSNPYCITDRFYDQVSMRSYPRQEIELNGGKVLSSLEMTFHCRMWGRYSKGTIKSRRGKMTHGTMAILSSSNSENASSNKPWWRRNRPILASFSAFRNSHEPTHEGLQDKVYFGY